MMMGHGLVGLLLAAVAGYWVLERASTHKGQLQKVGFAVGSLIIVVSLLGIICSVWCFGTSKSGMCPFGGKMGRGAYSPYIPPAPSSTK
jgi:hypothetical protein